ncbi:hypothetical protein P280DRAFT_473788 [Massarina eburnea CBS 473.64]|uniref:CENP-V/GFA domain-containing protein n=1 Tax=Massarina eburnea CBS 473.64 TaxID=1395130 RepID=A0A6A6RK39_9PLEO|nr:hypothetical protein P280DRAFT_473788 [Massarina eburnea CBS 473.64]
MSSQVYDGSCHCGIVQYKIRLTLPPEIDADLHEGVTLISKCNCSTCLKLNMFHTRPGEPATDFIVTSSFNISDLGICNAFRGNSSWYFWKRCGVQCFNVCGVWVQEPLDINKWVGKEGNGTDVQLVWRTVPYSNLGFEPEHFVSANAVTIEGVDLLEWHEKEWILYCENRFLEEGTSIPEARYRRPHPGGCY